MQWGAVLSSVDGCGVEWDGMGNERGAMGFVVFLVLAQRRGRCERKIRGREKER